MEFVFKQVKATKELNGGVFDRLSTFKLQI